jgi:hypothetical protein
LKVFRPQPAQDKDYKEYSLVALFPKGTNFADLEAKWNAVATEKFGDLQYANIRPIYQAHKDDKGALSDGDARYARTHPDKRAAYEPYRGCLSLNLRRREDQGAPQVIDANQQEIVDMSEFKSGDYARAVVEISAYTNKQGNQVSMKLVLIQKMREGEAIGGGGISKEAAMAALNTTDGATPPPSSADDLM